MAGQLFWGQEINDFDTGMLLSGHIRRSNLDGIELEFVAFGLGSVNGTAIAPSTPALARWVCGYPCLLLERMAWMR